MRAHGCRRAVFLSAKHAKHMPEASVSPAPNAYNVRSSTFGQQSEARFISQQGSSFPRSKRSYDQQHVRKMTTPGPGEYGVTSRAIGAQLESHHESAPNFKFGTAAREALAAKVLPSARHARVLLGTQSPAPGLYEARSALGAQIASQKATRPAFKFGSADRFYVEKQGARRAASALARASVGPPWHAQRSAQLQPPPFLQPR
jgi:hypothetical protein